MSEYEGLAKTVIKRTLRVRPKENVIVECWNHGLPVAREFVYQLRAAGARPMLLFEDEDSWWRSIATLPKTKLGQVGSHEWKAMDEADAYVFIPGPADISKVREFGWGRWRAAIDYNDDWYRRAKRNRLRGARIGLGYVTPQRAATYGVNVEAWRQSLLDASDVDPRQLVRSARRARTLLSKRGEVEVTAPNGTRFTCKLRGKKALVEDGMVTEDDLDAGENMANVPAGELYVVPDEKSGEGTLRFDRPLPYVGRWIRSLTLAFDGGRVSKWTAAENEAPLRRRWERAKGDKDRLALFQIGLNPRARTGFLQDYIVAGNVYVAIGGNDDVGGRNESEFYIGATLTGATVTVGGKAVVRSGALAA